MEANSGYTGLFEIIVGGFNNLSYTIHLRWDYMYFFLFNGTTFQVFVTYLIGALYVKFSPYRPGVAQRVDRVIALLFHDRGTRRW